MNEDDERLRRARLVFYEEDIARIDKSLDEFLANAKVKCALLVDKEGHMVTVRGANTSFDTDTISALVAASFAATREMARLLGEEEFSLQLHQGKRDNIHMSLIGDRTLLVAIFDEATTLGMVKLYAAEAAVKLEALFAERDAAFAAGVEVESSPEEVAAKGESKQEYNREAHQALDDLFGDD